MKIRSFTLTEKQIDVLELKAKEMKISASEYLRMILNRIFKLDDEIFHNTTSENKSKE
jgi:hypothetical protein